MGQIIVFQAASEALNLWLAEFPGQQVRLKVGNPCRSVARGVYGGFGIRSRSTVAVPVTASTSGVAGGSSSGVRLKSLGSNPAIAIAASKSSISLSEIIGHLRSCGQQIIRCSARLASVHSPYLPGHSQATLTADYIEALLVTNTRARCHAYNLEFVQSGGNIMSLITDSEREHFKRCIVKADLFVDDFKLMEQKDADGPKRRVLSVQARSR